MLFLYNQTLIVQQFMTCGIPGSVAPAITLIQNPSIADLLYLALLNYRFMRQTQTGDGLIPFDLNLKHKNTF